MSLWLGQSIAVHHRGTETQRISDLSSPIQNSEEPAGFISTSQNFGLLSRRNVGHRCIKVYL
ncbi:MAG: hypothetical protein METHSR3v1_1210029 [Methanothrix sp.]|nr:MAG: hypothetical protein METHSR3v1_1210029 [Methanothrix sp.]